MSSPASDVDAAREIRDGDDARAALVQLAGGDPADVAEALHDAALLGEVPPEARAGTLDHHDHAAPVASCRNTEPPIEIGLPVTISGTA